MTEKELRRLKRHELLQLLLAQVREADKVQGQLEKSQRQAQDLESSLERLKIKLDEKDAQIERLKNRLDQKDHRIRQLRDLTERYQKSRRIEMNEAGNIAGAVMRLNHIYEAAQKTAEQYLYNVRLLCGGEPDDDLDTEHVNRYLLEIEQETTKGIADLLAADGHPAEKSASGEPEGYSEDAEQDVKEGYSTEEYPEESAQDAAEEYPEESAQDAAEGFPEGEAVWEAADNSPEEETREAGVTESPADGEDVDG